MINVAVVLHRPRSPENVGAAARAMWNMGVSRLAVVDPLRWDEAAMMRLATRSAARLIQSLKVHSTLEEALGPFQFVLGTSARAGGLRKAPWTPRQAASRILALGEASQVAILFGPEDRGLTNHEIRLCNALVRIPTAQFASLNVAQSVLVLCYELYLASMAPRASTRPHALAKVEDLERMYSRLQEILVKIGLIHPRHADSGMMKVRQFLSRVGLQSNEVQMILGLCRQIAWYACSSTSEAMKGARQGERS
jgi:tRNA/rRNA methyltransferase